MPKRANSSASDSDRPSKKSKTSTSEEQNKTQKGKIGPRSNGIMDTDEETAAGAFRYEAEETAEYVFNFIYGEGNWNPGKVYSSGENKGKERKGRLNQDERNVLADFNDELPHTASWWQNHVKKIAKDKPSKTTHTHLNAIAFAIRETFPMLPRAATFQEQVRGQWQPDSFKANMSTRGRSPFLNPTMTIEQKIKKARETWRQDRSRSLSALLRSNLFKEHLDHVDKIAVVRKVNAIYNEGFREFLSVNYGITMKEHGKDYELFIGVDRDIDRMFTDFKGVKQIKDSNQVGRSDMWEVADLDDDKDTDESEKEDDFAAEFAVPDSHEQDAELIAKAEPEDVSKEPEQEV